LSVIRPGLLKWTLNEGIARWQLATGTSLLAGWAYDGYDGYDGYDS
jgi:hypothetical protein